MPRSARIDIPNLMQHVIVRGIEKRDIFADDDDRRRFVKRFSTLLVSTETDCFAWALLDNHFHLLLRTNQIPLSTFMRRLLTGYAVSFNLRHHRSGHLFQNRYKSLVCDEEEYLLELVRYIHLNPLRAGLVENIDELERYPWCGHAILLENGDLPGQVKDEVLARFGKVINISRRNYRQFIRDGLSLGRRNDLVGTGMQRRQAAEEELRDPRVLGGGDFVKQLLRHREPEPIPAKMTLDEIIDRVRTALDLPLTELMSRNRASHVALARSIICHIAFACGHRGVDISRRLGITGAAVTLASRRGGKTISQHPDLLELLRDSR